MDRDACAVPSYNSNELGSEANLHGGWSVVYLLKPVVSLIVTPIDEDRSVIDTRAVLAPTFKSYMSLGQGSYGRSMP